MLHQRISNSLSPNISFHLQKSICCRFNLPLQMNRKPTYTSTTSVRMSCTSALPDSLHSTCPSLFFSAPLKQKSSSLLQNTLVCPYCSQWLQPDNHRIRLRPKKLPSARVQSILRRKARGKRLSLVQKNLLHRFQTSSSVLVRRNTRWLCFVPHCSTLSLQRAQCIICYPLR